MSALRPRLLSGVTTVARAWVVARKDGLILGFTDHDRDLTVDGVLCRASTGMGAGAVQAGTGLAVDNSEVVGALSHDAIRAEDIRAGRWDEAEVTAYLADWQASQHFDILFRGQLGEISEGSGQFSAELRGLAERLNAVRGRVYHARCDAVLGDARCGIDLTLPNRTVTARITRMEEGGRRLWIDVAGDLKAHWFVRGRIAFVDGSARGLDVAIKADEPVRGGRLLELWTAPNATPAPGDEIQVIVGCDKAMATCRDKFLNMENFRGFPHIPGDDWLLAAPSLGAR